MIGQAFSHYSITQKLGEGGMGVVYRAHDRTLHRDVALKFLAIDSIDDRLAREKVLQEARAISAVNHPNICTIYEVGEAEGRPYIAMEYVEGHPLSSEIAQGGLSIDVVVRYGLQLADALGHAHERNIVHRDLKSANVIVTPSGRLKVLDFGLSKRGELGTSEDTTQFDQTWYTQPSLTGTLPYMAPELLKGQNADARSDIWALGVMLYEMAAGRRPFRGATSFELSAAILRESPKSVLPVLPSALQAVIDNCLDKDPSQRYHSGGEVRAALEAVESSTRSQKIYLENPADRRNPRTNYLRSGVAVALVVLASSAGLWWASRIHRTPQVVAPIALQSLAVLPLENLSGDSAQDYFADGMTDALITELSQIRKLRVISRTSVMQYKHTQKSLGNIAQELNVDAVVEGSVLRSSDRVRISTKLIQTSNEQSLWAESYERDFTDVLALQSDIASSIARSIQVELSAAEILRLANHHPVVPAAYEAYLRGQYEFAKRTPEGIRSSTDYFKDAISKDPTFATAYAGLADSLRFQSNYQILSPENVIPEAKAAAEKALQLDPDLAEAHASLATTRFYHLEWDGVESEFQRAIALNPGYAPALHWYALYLAAVGRREESITEIKLAREIDPRSLIINANVAWCYYLAGDPDHAIEAAKNTLRFDPSFAVAHGYLGQAYLQKKQYDLAIDEFRKTLSLSPGDFVRQSELANAYAQAGRTKQSQEILSAFLNASKDKYISPYDWAMLYAGFRDKEKTLRWLDKAFEERNGRLANLAVHPQFAFLRGTPAFEELLSRIGLPRNVGEQTTPDRRRAQSRGTTQGYS